MYFLSEVLKIHTKMQNLLDISWGKSGCKHPATFWMGSYWGRDYIIFIDNKHEAFHADSVKFTSWKMQIVGKALKPIPAKC